MIFILVLGINGYIHQFLHQTPALDNQCSDQNTIGQNYFIGEKYFYNYITQNGAFVDFSKVTFILWIKFVDNNPYKSVQYFLNIFFKKTGRQILFQLVDGSDDNPFVNLQLSVFPLNGQLQLALFNGFVKTSYKPQYMLSLSNVANANKLLGWNQIVVSLDQSASTSYMNMKLYDSYKNTYYQSQVPVINGTIFSYRISEQMRITNEALIGQRNIDTRACAFIAKFEYYLGWVTMDTELLMDYSSQLEFYVKPNGLSLDSLVNSIILKSYSGAYYNSEFLNIYKNTRIEYIFKQQMDSFALSFWMNPNILSQGPINPNYQLFSLADDSLLNTAVGLGVNNQLQLLLYQKFEIKILSQLNPGWTHIIAYFVQNSWNDDFVPQKNKLMYIYINGVNTTQFSIENKLQWSRIIIGFLFRDREDINYVSVRELQIYSGMGIQRSRYGCLIFSDSNCVLCDPKNPQFTFSANLCPQQTQITNQNCQTGTAACNITTTSGLQKYYSILCQNGYVFSAPQCISGSSYPCGWSMNKGCFNCQSGTLKTLTTGATRCIPECTSQKNGYYNFNDAGTCKQVCPYYAIYKYDCAQSTAVVTCVNQCPSGYVVVNSGICLHPDFAPILQSKLRKFDPIKGLISTYTFVPSANLQNYATLRNAKLLFPYSSFDQSKTLVQYFKGCQKVFIFPIQQNIIQLCIYPCGLCFYNTKSSCLTCQDQDQFLDRQFSSCVTSCDKTLGILKLNSRLTMTCEQFCPSGLIQQNIECVQSCSANYYAFNGICVKTIPAGYFVDSNIVKACPQVCKSCSSQLICQTCVGSYPMDGNMCVTKCPQFLDFPTNTCVSACQANDLIYQTNNLNGFSFSVCFKLKCGIVQANKRIQTVQHQTNLNQCAQPCDDGYYADYGVLKCQLCQSPCVTCQDKQDFCLTCIDNLYFFQNGCFNNCPDLFEDNINKQCVGGCDDGYQLDINNVKACVEYCDNNKYGIISYYYKFYCLETPYISSYCVGQYCYDCDSSCYTCNGPNNNQCLSCINLFLYNNICHIACPDDLYSISTTWDCQLSCPLGTFTMDGQKACFNPCPNGTYQYNNQCYLQQQLSTYCNKIEQTFMCYDCYQTCYSCTNKLSTTCTSCKTGFYLWEGTCKSSCPKGTYKYEKECLIVCPNNLKMQDDQCVSSCDASYISFVNYCGLTCPNGTYKSASTCSLCYLGCATCTDLGFNQCQSCTFGYYLQQDTVCDTQCPIDIPYKNQISNICAVECPDIGYINQAIDATYCVKKCPSYYYGRLCQISCPDQTWANGYECRVCAKNCTVCYGDLISQCTQCLAGNYLDQSTCVEQCPILRPYANQVDKKCLDKCPLYTQFELMYCFSICPSYLYRYELNPLLLECVKSCYPSSYVSGQFCLACAPECIQCYESNPNSCIYCQTGFYLSGTTCQSTCPSYYDETNLSCVPNCDPYQYQFNNQCLSICPAGHLVYQMKCVTQCPPITYLLGLQCLSCDYSCLECQDGTNLLCTQCISNYFINGSTCTLVCPKFYDYINYKCVDQCSDGTYLINNNQCVASCPVNYLIVQDVMKCVQQCQTGYYQDSTQCKKCDYTCSECSAINKCSACTENFALNIDQCVQICWQNSILFYDKTNRLCQSKCPNYHYTSYGKYLCVDQCDQYYYGSFCIDQCPLGLYGDAQNICQLCPSNCLECNALNNCTSCQDQFVLTGGSCATDCISQYLDVQNKECVDSCPINQYLLDDQCLASCPSPQYFSYNFVCVDTCPSQTYRDDQYCLDCSQECQNCVGPTSSDCEKCAQDYYLNSQICTKTCPVNYYYDMYNYVCTLKCDKNLFELDDKCLKVCPILSYFEKCLGACPLHTYQYNLVCQDCKSICLTCNQYECLSCINGYYLNNGQCGLLCQKFYDQVNNKCVDQCDTSLYTFMNQCISVCPILPTYSYQQQCLIDCPDRTAINGNKCDPCQERCQKCQSTTICELCEQGYYLNNGACIVACPIASPYQDTGVCVVKCPDNTYYYQNSCVNSCPNKLYLQQCIDKCPDGYFGDICSPCKSQCKTCSTYQTCTSCNPHYFLEQTVCDTQCPYIYDTIRWECTNMCNGLQFGQYCYSSCPIGSLQQGKLCKNACDDGFFNLNNICVQCPRECQLCTTATICQSCSISYYLHDQQCLSICPLGLFSDPKSNKCITDCSSKMFRYQRQCLYSCPKGYVANKNECTQNCSNNQIQIGKICQDCPLECDGCTGITNSDCIKCSSTAIQKDKICQSISCLDGYYLLDDQCNQCYFQCQTCDYDKCLTCKGDRVTNQCICKKGYFDDGQENLCQQCPCEECTSINTCTKCKNNLQIPNCSCDRQLNSEWCINCDVGRTNIQFSYDLSQIIIDFGYLISINMINPFQLSDCKQWFVNSNILGIDSSCYLKQNRTQVIIILGSQSTVNIGDQLDFQINFYKDVNDQECTGFIQTFINTTVRAPELLIKPYIQFDNPDLVSPCKKTTIRQISILGTGQRDLQILEWKLIQLDLDDNHYFELDYYLQQMGDSLVFDVNILQPNQTYAITARYTNILSRLNTTTFKFQTNPSSKPYVYLTYNPLMVHGYIFDCQTFLDLQTTYTLSILIQYQNNTLLNQNLIMVDKFQIDVNESLLPKGQMLEVTASIDDIIIKKNVTLKLLPLQLSFQQQSRFLGLQGHITARGYDPNINDKTLAQLKLNYQWVCTNLHNLQPCKSQQNQIMQFPNSRVLQLSIDSPNITFAFYCNASKDNGWVVLDQKIVITNLNIENDFVENEGDSIGHINPNDDIFIILKKPQQYAMIMYNYLLVGTIKIFRQGLQFKLGDYLNYSQGDITIYLLPSNESMKYSINYVKVIGQLQISPETGYSLDQFQITMNISNTDQLDLPLKYGFLQYMKYSLMELDVQNYQNVNGLPLGSFQSNDTILAYLSNGLDKTYILCQIIDNKGFVIYFNTSIKVQRKFYSYQQSIINLPQNQSLQQLNAALQMLKEESKQVCLKQCSGVGTCIKGKCQCPPGYYFDDCSGNKTDKEIQYRYISNTFDHLFNSSIQDDQQYKLFIDSLSYLTTYQESFDLLNKEKALIYLNIVTTSLSNRINKINQLTINLEYNQLQNLQYDQLDISQVVQMSDLKKTMICHDLIWYYLLNNNTDIEKYTIQYQTRQTLSQIIQLTFYILKPDDYVDFSGAGGKLFLNRTNQSIQKTHYRILASNNQYYDTVQAKFINNLYSDDGYFPYPNQTQPLYDYSVRLSGRSQNIQLEYNINYTFTVEAENRYICIMRNSTTYQWEHTNCNTSYSNQTIICNCSKYAPTTIVNDYDYLVYGVGEKRIVLPNLIPFILFSQILIWICLFVASLHLDRHILDSQITHDHQYITHGIVKQLNRQRKSSVSFNLDGIPNINEENGMEPNSPDKSIQLHDKHFNHHLQLETHDNHSHLDIHINHSHQDLNDRQSPLDHQDNHEIHTQFDIHSLKDIHDNKHNDDHFNYNSEVFNQTQEFKKVNIGQKYSLENFQIQHSILNIIYKYKKYQPRWFRSTLILMRWTFCLSFSGVFAYLQLLYEISVYPSIGGFLVSRIIETFITQQFKQTSYINSVVLKVICLFVIFIILAASLIGFWMIYIQIIEETDWIISYLMAFLVDLLLLDLISMIANKYLGEEAKVLLRKKVKRIKKQQEVQKQIRR